MKIGLSAWIIQDGNYTDFAVGEEKAFAVEFSYANKDEILVSGSGTPQLVYQTESYYDTCGKIIWLSDQYSILDFGQIIAYSGQLNLKQEPDLKLGDFINGNAYWGVDPFFYKEDLEGKSGVPDIIYPWKIAGILMEIGPYIEDEKRKLKYRDPDKKGHKDIKKTNAWGDEAGGAGHYILDCERINRGN